MLILNIRKQSSHFFLIGNETSSSIHPTLSVLKPYFSYAPISLCENALPWKCIRGKCTLAMYEDHSQIRSLSISSICDWLFCFREWAFREVWGTHTLLLSGRPCILILLMYGWNHFSYNFRNLWAIGSLRICSSIVHDPIKLSSHMTLLLFPTTG